MTRIPESIIKQINNPQPDFKQFVDVATVRKRARQIMDACVPGGRYAFGSGNSITNYCKKENILAMFDETYQWSAA